MTEKFTATQWAEVEGGHEMTPAKEEPYSFLKDIHESDLVIVMGQNPGTNHPRMLSSLEKCTENGGTIISVNPIGKKSPFQLFKSFY